MADSNIENRLLELENQVQQILDRNAKVEIDKSWETSKFRVFIICLLTWVIIAIVFKIIGITNYIASAVIPTLGFYLSTLSLPIIKKWWVSFYNHE